LRAVVAVVLVVLASSSPAFAKGTMRVQQADGSVQVYENVRIAVAGRQLKIATADKKGVLLIDRAACTVANKVTTCIPDRVQLKQNGVTKALDFERGTVYFNTSQSPAQLSLSSTQLPPNGTLGSMKSPKGTYVTWTGTLDSYTK